MSPDIALVAYCGAHNRKTLGRFLNTLSFVPDDRLAFRPSESSRTAWDLAAHVVFGNFLMGDMYGVPFAADDPERARQARLAENPDPSCRAELADLIQRTSDRVLAAIEALNSEGLDEVVETFFGVALPRRALLLIPARHLDTHAAQIDYLQTIWGDMENHM